MFVGVDVLGDPQYTNFGRDVVFSADLWYNWFVGRGLVSRRNEKFCFRQRRHQGTALQGVWALPDVPF